MSFNWVSFLQTHNISYVDSGANVSRDDVAVRCPFCGSADPSHHMTINVNGRGWYCWRNRDHRGRKASRLIQALIGCSREQASQIAGELTYVPEDLVSSVNALLSPKKEDRPDLVELPEFKKLSNSPVARPYINYLTGRGFDKSWLLRRGTGLGLRYCTRGVFKGRVIFLIKHEKKLVSWTGRTIFVNDQIPRYNALTDDLDRAREKGLIPSHGPISSYLLWYDRLLDQGGDTLYVTEGPMDALKVAMLGRRMRARATCVFTAQPSEAQIGLLHDLIPRFNRTVVLLDASALGRALWTHSALASLGVELGKLPSGADDPGKLNARTFAALHAM